MAQPKYRHIPLYIGNRKFAEAGGFVFDSKSGDEQVFDSDGLAGLTDGIITSTVKSDYVQPVAGTKIDLHSLFFNKTDFVVAFPVGGKIISWPARITDLNITSDSKTGNAKGSITITQSGPATVK